MRYFTYIVSSIIHPCGIMKKHFKTLFLLFVFVLSITSCKQKNPKIPAFNSTYGTYINAFTSGVVSKKATIHIGFTQPVKDSLVTDALLEFEPEIKGKVVLSQMGLDFIPEEDLTAGQVYTAKLALHKLAEVPDSMKFFEFGFQVLRPAYEWGSIQLLAAPETQMTWYTLKGVVIAADQENVEDLEEILQLKVGGEKLGAHWQVGASPLQLIFETDSVERKEKAQEIEITVNENAPGTERLNSRKVPMPALGDFTFIDHAVLTSPSTHVRLNFSDPIDQSQDLSGLIALEGESNLRFEIENTSILVYPQNEVFGHKKLNIYAGIKNIRSYKFKSEKELTLEFRNEKPQVRLVGDGNILPINEKLLLPFQAISLKAVDVKVVKIPEQNVLQFLQANNYAGQSELYRVGEVVATKKIDLTSKKTLKSWNSYSLDLSGLITPEPGAVYRVYFSFSKEYSLYDCYEQEAGSDDQEDDYYWYYDDEYYYNSGDREAYNRSDYYFNYPSGYRWSQRNNPCHVSYYRSDQFAVRNLWATNLGLIVKAGGNEKLDFTVTDMVANTPVSGADVSVYNYQGRKLFDSKTDANGFASVPDKDRPYFAVAAKGKQKTYMRLQAGEALSLSNFDVGGSSVASGIKGFIYGERGVWRPGDTLFLNFILEDEQNRLPEGYPIHFTLEDPQAMLVDKQLAKKGSLRIYNFTTKTAASAVTGSYKATVRVGDRVFTERIRVETVKPNRLKVDLKFTDEILETNANGEATAQLSVDWLTGIPAANSKVDIEANLSALQNGFEAYPSFIFYDPVRAFESSQHQAFSGQVDANGKASVTLDLGNFQNAPGMMRSRFVMKAFEGGGDFSTQYVDKKIAPYQSFVGIEMPKPKGSYLETDQEYNLKIKTLDAQGEAVDRKDLEVKVYKVDYHWWYNSQDHNLAKFVNNEVSYLVSQGKVSTTNGSGSYKLKVKYPSWGRFLVRVCDPVSGHCSGQIAWFDWPYGTKGSRPELAGSTMLSFTAEKEKVQIGEDIVVQIPVGEAARVLVTVENGIGIIKKEWVEATGENVVYRVKATPEMAPNVYISASLLQAHAQTLNDRPIRLFGVVPVEVYDPETRLEPQITTTEKWRPESKVKVKVNEKTGKAMNYTLAVVDEGLLNLTNFKTPDPWKHFYAKEALGVKTWDMYNDVLGAFGGSLEQIFAIGGDAELLKKENSNQNRFVPMVRHMGPFTLEAGASATHEIEVPNYVGSVRIMVVAADDKSAYGNTQKEVKVIKPLMVLSTLPRILSPGDEVTMPITVFAMEDQVREVSLKLKTTGDVVIDGAKSKTVTFTKTGEQVVDFKLKVPEVWGAATVRVEASSGSEKAYDETNLKVRLPNPPVNNVVNFTLKPGADTTLNYKPLGISKTNFAQVEASTIPLINLNTHLKYLFSYPYGCTEQITSRAFPLLFVADIIDLTDDMKVAQKQNVSIALQAIYERQKSNGEIKYWPGSYSDRSNFYITNYAGHFMIEAEKKGYQIADGVLARWKKFQQTAARNWRDNDKYNTDFEQAYRLYTLALYKSADVGAMNRLRETPNLKGYAMWYLAAAYNLIGEKEEAQRIAQRAIDKGDGGYYGMHYYGTYLRNISIELMVLNQLGKQNEAFRLGREVAKKLNNSESYWTTHDLSFAVMAMSQTYGQYTKSNSDLLWSYSSDSERYKGKSKGSYETYEIQSGTDKNFTYTLANNAAVPINFAVASQGTPITYNVPAVSSNLSVDVHYTYPNGDALDVARIKQGQDFIATVTVTRKSKANAYENMALNQILPTGWEIINTRLLEVPEGGEDAYDYKDIRDDRVYTFFDLSNFGSDKSATFKVRLNATYAGKYWLPPVVAEDMYNDEVYARTAGRWIEVVR